MSFFKFMFDTEYRQRQDIEELRESQYRLALSSGGGASEKWVEEIADEVKELAATVRVLMRKLSEAGTLDLASVREQVAEELKPKPKQRKDTKPGPAGPVELPIEVTCTKCHSAGWSNEMVKAGADWMCRPCARNP